MMAIHHLITPKSPALCSGSINMNRHDREPTHSHDESRPNGHSASTSCSPMQNATTWPPSSTSASEHRNDYRRQAPPVVFVRLYDALAARCAAEAQGLSERLCQPTANDSCPTNVMKRRPSSDSLADASGSANGSSSGDLSHRAKRVKTESNEIPRNETHFRRADTTTPPPLRSSRRPSSGSWRNDSDASEHTAHVDTKPDINAHINTGAEAEAQAVAEAEPEPEPSKIELLRHKRRSISSPPDFPASSSCPPPPVPAHALRGSNNNNESSCPHDATSIQPSNASRNTNRRKSSEALVDVIKSFEVVLQYRALGWRILDSAPTAVHPTFCPQLPLMRSPRLESDKKEDKEPQRRYSTRY